MKHNILSINFFTDIDECTEGTDDCDDNATCENTIGSFTCTCNDGYSGSGEECKGEWYS